MLLPLAQSIAARRPPCARLLARCVAPRFPLPRMACAAAEVDGRAALRDLAPPLLAANHKGQAGRIGVVGGCLEYTGAPFFAAYSALRVGADLAHLFCTRDAAPAIKSYSPELIVHPCLPDAREVEARGLDALLVEQLAADTVCDCFPRLNALVVGCGLGRDAHVLAVAEAVVRSAIEHGLPLVVDGDGLLLVTRRPQLLTERQSQAARVILTPNVNEYRRLCECVGIAVPDVHDVAAVQASLASMSRALGGATILCKGAVDLIAAGDAPVLVSTEPGAPRRCGGQGDVLAGTTAVMAAWAQRGSGSLQHAAFAASTLVRATAARTFAATKRSMVAGDLIPELGPTMEALAPCCH